MLKFKNRPQQAHVVGERVIAEYTQYCQLTAIVEGIKSTDQGSTYTLKDDDGDTYERSGIHVKKWNARDVPFPAVLWFEVEFEGSTQRAYAMPKGDPEKLDKNGHKACYMKFLYKEDKKVKCKVDREKGNLYFPIDNETAQPFKEVQPTHLERICIVDEHPVAHVKEAIRFCGQRPYLVGGILDFREDDTEIPTVEMAKCIEFCWDGKVKQKVIVLSEPDCDGTYRDRPTSIDVQILMRTALDCAQVTSMLTSSGTRTAKLK